MLPPAMSSADIAKLQPLMGLAWLDEYRVVRVVTRVRDSQGAIVPVSATVEFGRCNLRRVGNQPSEGTVSGRTESSNMNEVDLPTDVDVTPDDDLIVNGDHYEVLGIHRAGGLGLYVTAVVTRKS